MSVPRIHSLTIVSVADPKTPADVVQFFTTQLPGLTFGIDDTESVESLLTLYPDDLAAGSPYGTGNETFGRSAEYKRAASILGDLVFEVRHYFALISSHK